jgi:hypothetical protein
MRCPECGFRFGLFRGLKVDPNPWQVLRGAAGLSPRISYRKVCPECKVQLVPPRYYRLRDDIVFLFKFLFILSSLFFYAYVSASVEQRQALKFELEQYPIYFAMPALAYLILDAIRKFPAWLGDLAYEKVATPQNNCVKSGSKNALGHSLKCWKCGSSFHRKPHIDIIINFLVLMSFLPIGLGAWDLLAARQRTAERVASENYINWEQSLPIFTPSELAKRYRENMFAANRDIANRAYKIRGLVKRVGQSHDGVPYLEFQGGDFLTEQLFTLRDTDLFTLSQIRFDSNMTLT